MSPLVAIILVNYNGFNDTVECVKSLLNISYDNYKIFVVNNGSSQSPTDAELVFLKKHVVYVNLEENIGFSGGNNAGIEAAKWYNPEFYLLINNDTTVEPECITNLLGTYFDNDNVGIVTGRIRFYDDPSRIWFAGGNFDFKLAITSHIGYLEIDNPNYQTDKMVTFATGCLWLLPKRTIREVGLLDEKYFLYCEDTDYCLKVLNSGLKIIYSGKACIYHKVSASTGNGSDMQNYYMIRNSLYIIDKFLSNKIRARIRILLRMIKYILLRKIKFKVVLHAYSDHKKGIIGKLRN